MTEIHALFVMGFIAVLVPLLRRWPAFARMPEVVLELRCFQKNFPRCSRDTIAHFSNKIIKMLAASQNPNAASADRINKRKITTEVFLFEKSLSGTSIE
jgi:hypothetical protein